MKLEKIPSGPRAGQVLATYAVPIDAEEVTGEQGTAIVFSEFFIESDIENVDAALDRIERIVLLAGALALALAGIAGYFAATRALM